jgi:hypothetical protein
MRVTAPDVPAAAVAIKLPVPEGPATNSPSRLLNPKVSIGSSAEAAGTITLTRMTARIALLDGLNDLIQHLPTPISL